MSSLYCATVSSSLSLLLFCLFQDLYKTIPTEAALRFVDECSQDETVWRVAMETKPSLLSLVSSISQPWEAEFGVDLQVNVCIEPEQS